MTFLPRLAVAAVFDLARAALRWGRQPCTCTRCQHH